jgi:hypothetical protein
LPPLCVSTPETQNDDVYHSPVDEEAPDEDALVSVERLRRRGATVGVRTLPGLDHATSWIQALPRAVRWFRALE